MNLFAMFLKDQLELKQKKNSAYSLRSFARDLNLDHSSLSKIIAGSRVPEVNLALRILDLLKVTSEEKLDILDSVRKETNIKNFKIKKAVNEYSEVNQKMFEVISDSNHYAFLELLKTSNFKNDLSYISKRLSVSEQRVEEIMNNLVALNMININSNSTITDLTQGFSTHEVDLEVTTHANKKYQVDLLDKSKQSILNQDMRDRSHSAIVFATNKSKVYEAKGIIKKFRQSLCDFMEDTEDKDEVYALQVSLFSVTED